MDCPICIDTMETPFSLHQCGHSFHATCVLKSMDVYLANYGTEWQTVPCPICRKRISYHIILKEAIKTCSLSELTEIVNDDNKFTSCWLTGSLLHVAADQGRDEIVKLLTQKGLPADSKNPFGLTPVYYAAYKGHTSIVKYLVETHHVNIDCQNIFGNTMLDMAIKNKHKETVQYLCSVGAKQSENPRIETFGEFKTTVVDIICSELVKKLPNIM